MPRSRSAPRAALVTLALTLLAGCGDAPSGPPVPRDMVAVLVSPSGPEGAAVLDLSGGGFSAVRADSGTTLFAEPSGNAARVVLIRSEAGELRFRLRLENEKNPPSVTVVEVADGADALRDPGGYTVRFERAAP